jgi:hypothetical protein
VLRFPVLDTLEEDAMDVMEAFGISYAEAIGIQALNLETALWMIQFWITATFGLVVAFHFAGTQLSRSMSGLMQTLYVSVSGISMMTYIQSCGAVLLWNNNIDSKSLAMGLITQAQFDSAAFWRTGSVIGGGALIALGTIATLYYGIHLRRSEAD